MTKATKRMSSAIKSSRVVLPKVSRGQRSAVAKKATSRVAAKSASRSSK